MLSYTSRRNLFVSLTNASDSATLTLADILMNASEKRILTKKSWPFLERALTITTTASTQFKNLPALISKVSSVYVTVGSTRYTPIEASSRAFWDKLNVNNITSDYPEYWFVFNGQLGLYPIPATSSNVITVNCRIMPKNLTIADYTTGGILTATNGSTSIVGTGTSWTSSMVGRWLNITESDTANKGDGNWYEVESVTNSTTLVLKSAYQGTSIFSGNAAYTIGQMSLLPEGYHELPVYEAVRVYYASIQPDVNKFKIYDGLYKEMMLQLINDFSNKSDNPVINRMDYLMDNPNLHIITTSNS